jgi:asparagine synthase (glutamine-hydrolysing)
MCGIAGLATRDGVRSGDAALVEGMLRTLLHRGPDDLHQAGDDRAIIGATRLAIIDLDTGRQPLTNEDGCIRVSQNGEIYDYVELREALQRKGHRFSTKGDTEMIAHLYEEHGEAYPAHLRGMFATAVWDGNRQRLVLARDRLGKKPLYWRLADGRLTWGSELKAILVDPTVERTVDRRALARYLQYGYVPAPDSILEGIHKLPPASILVWDGGEPRIERYWTPAYEPKTSHRPGEDRAELHELLRESVRLRLRSDVPVGAFLSGGMDSSVVVALMAESSAEPVRTFTIGFDEKAYDERHYARAVAQHFGTRHTEEVVRLDAVDLLPELADHYDEPFGDSSAIPTFRVARLAARELKVVLTGDGGDEAFGGYARYGWQAALGTLGRIGGPLHVPAVGVAQAILRAAAPRSKLRRRADAWRRYAERSEIARYVAIMSQMHLETRIALLGDATLADQDGYLADTLAEGPADQLDRTLRADTLTYLPEDLLVKMDRATMANSVEARAPLLDHHVVEFAARLPTDRKMHRRVTKVILREVARDLLPARMVDRPKKGFGVPVGSWFRHELGDRFHDEVLAPDARSRDHLDQSAAADLLRAHRAGEVDNGARLWNLLMFEAWARRWLDVRSDLA